MANLIARQALTLAPTAVVDDAQVDVRRSSTGSRARTLSDARGDVISLKDFAYGDGVTDDWAHIVDAIAAVPANGTLKVPPGVYRLSQPVVVTRGDLTIAGEGRYRSIFKPDATISGGGTAWYVFRFLGTSGAHLAKAEVRDIGLNGSNRPVGNTDFYACIRFDYVDSVEVDGIWSIHGHDTVNLLGCAQFQISRLHVQDNEESCVTLFTGVLKGTISNIVAEDVDEVVDTFNNDEIVISNIRAKAFTGTTQEAFDLSSCRKATITDAICTGFFIGVDLKAEAGTGITWADIEIHNCQFHECTQGAVKLTSSEGASARVNVSGCLIRSSVAGSYGVWMSAASNDAFIEDNDIVVAGVGVDCVVWNELAIRNNRRIASTGGQPAIRAYSSGGGYTTKPIITGNRRISGGTAGSTFGAIDVQNGNRPDVSFNEVTSSNETGIHLKNCLYPRVCHNRVLAANRQGIQVWWNDVTAIDNTNKIIGAVVDGNEVRNWGQASANRNGIFIQVTTVGTGETWKDVTCSNNRCILEGSVTVNGHIGIQFDKGPLAAIDYSKCDHNFVERAATPYAVTLGANSSVSNNNGGANIPESQVTNLVTDLAGKAATVHTHTLSQITDAGTAAAKTAGNAVGNVPMVESGGKLNAAILPTLSTGRPPFVVASQAAMLALSTAVVGDIAKRTDLGTSFMLAAADYTLLANWVQLTNIGVTTVNGLSGDVNLTTFNVNEGTNLYYTTARVNADAPNVTLNAAVDTFLSLSGQQLTLDTQTANLVWAGPTTGAAATPTFRALVVADLPSLGYANISDFATGVTATLNASSIDAMSDVTLTTPATGHVLQYSGTAFVNRTLSAAGIAALGGGNTFTELQTVNVTSGSPLTVKPPAAASVGVLQVWKDETGVIVAQVDDNGQFSSTLFSGTFSGGGPAITGLNADNIATGTVTPARLGTGASATTWLRGNSTFSAILDADLPTVTTYSKLSEARARLSTATTTTGVTAVTTGLSFAVGASENWEFDVELQVQCSSTGGIKFSITGPVAGNVESNVYGTAAAVTAITSQRITALATLTTIIFNNAAIVGWVRIRGTYRGGANAGTVTFNFASVTSGQTSTMHIGSNLIAHRI
jgi:hypothetical protein